MNTLGPFNINPFLLQYPQQPIPIQIGINGFVEIINLTNFNITVNLQANGSAFQEQRSKCCYRVVNSLGTQMLTLSPQISGTFADIPKRYVRTPPGLENGEIGFLGVYVNIYEDGEIEWYPPVALSPPPTQACYFASGFSSGGALTLTLPTTETFFVGITPGTGTCYLLGFDFTASTAAAAATGSVAIQNLNNQPDGSTILNYGVVVNTTIGTTISIRFPTPIPNALGQQIKLVFGGASTAFSFINAFYSLT